MEIDRKFAFTRPQWHHWPNGKANLEELNLFLADD